MQDTLKEEMGLFSRAVAEGNRWEMGKLPEGVPLREQLDVIGRMEPDMWGSVGDNLCIGDQSDGGHAHSHLVSHLHHMGLTSCTFMYQTHI